MYYVAIHNETKRVLFKSAKYGLLLQMLTSIDMNDPSSYSIYQRDL